MSKICDFIIHSGLLFLIIFTPLAFGTVQPWSITIMELVTLLIVLVWFLKMMHRGEFRFIKTLLTLPLLLFIALILVQLLPLPPSVIKHLSPNTYNLYQMTLPGYDNVESYKLNVIREKDTKSPNTLPRKMYNVLTYNDSSWRSISISKHATKIELLKFLTYLAIFFVVINNFRRREQISRVISLVIALGFALSVFAIIQNLSGTDKVYWFQKLSQGGSPYGPYVNRNHFAGYISMVIPLALGLLISRQLSVPSGYYFRSKLPTGDHQLPIVKYSSPLILLIFAITIMITALFLSLSRGGILSFLLSMILMLNLFFIWQRSSRMRLYMIPFSVFLFAFLFLAHLGINPVIQQLSTIFHIEQEGSATARFAVWQDTFTTVKDYPLLGTGLGTFQYIFPKYRAASSEVRLYFDYAHNDYLQLLQESGLLGFGLIIVGISAFLWKVFTKWRERHDPFIKGLTMGGLTAAFSILFHSLVDFNLHIPANALLFSLILGLTYSLVHCRDGGHSRS